VASHTKEVKKIYDYAEKYRVLQDCDIVVKRHLWRDNQSLFGDEVSPYLSQV